MRTDKNTHTDRQNTSVFCSCPFVFVWCFLCLCPSVFVCPSPSVFVCPILSVFCLSVFCPSVVRVCLFVFCLSEYVRILSVCVSTQKNRRPLNALIACIESFSFPLILFSIISFDYATGNIM
ncbi:unnamed protein product [Meloidogyne enterolobii]|uniref:Uncharacterized protein n=1 Tax=Meloidogyne enterolobii TaxID=390850 RepID=A0ACB0ZZN2_MELEN